MISTSSADYVVLEKELKYTPYYYTSTDVHKSEYRGVTRDEGGHENVTLTSRKYAGNRFKKPDQHFTATRFIIVCKVDK